MANSLRASTKGLAIADRARQRRGWTKTSTARWWQDAHTSRATLRRFWQGDRIQRDIFIAICEAVGVSNWEAIADLSDLQDPAPADPPQLTPLMDWEEAPDVESFYGRTQELDQLEQWMVGDRCKLVGIYGLGGIGKTALALAVGDRVQAEFECLIWRSLQTAPPLLHLLDSLLETLAQTIAQDILQSTHQLMQYFRERRCLLVLDGLEAVLPDKDTAQSIEYRQFLQQLIHTRHQSCLLITSREQPSTLDPDAKAARWLNLQGLPKTEALELLQAKGFSGKELGLSALIRLYRGNPLALKIVTPLVQSVFGGNVAAFLNQNTLMIGDRLQAILKQQLDQLSHLERDILYWLAIWQEPVSFGRLQSHLRFSTEPTGVLEGILALERRSLLEKWFSAGEPSFTLQPLVMKAARDALVEQAAQEMIQVAQSHDIGHFRVLRTHWLLRPGTDDIAGDRILMQLREKLWRKYGAALPDILRPTLLQLQVQTPLAMGYIGCNLMAILKQLDLTTPP